VTATFDPALSTPKDQVRDYIGDTNVSPESSAKLSDEQITARLMQNDNDALKTAIVCASSIAAKYADQADTTVGDVSVRLSQIADRYTKLCASLKQMAKDDLVSSGVAAPFAGGISIASKQSYEDDTDRVVPSFGRDGTGSTGPRFRRERW